MASPGGGGREAVTSTTLHMQHLVDIVTGVGEGAAVGLSLAAPPDPAGLLALVQLGFCLWFLFSRFLARLICTHHQGHPPPPRPTQLAPRDQLQGVPGTVARGERGHYCRGATAGPHPLPGLHFRKPPRSLPSPSTPDSLQAPPSAHSPAPVSESLQAPPCHSHHTLRPPSLKAVPCSQGGVHPGSPAPPELSSPQATANSSPGGGAPGAPRAHTRPEEQRWPSPAPRAAPHKQLNLTLVKCLEVPTNPTRTSSPPNAQVQ